MQERWEPFKIFRNFPEKIILRLIQWKRLSLSHSSSLVFQHIHILPKHPSRSSKVLICFHLHPDNLEICIWRSEFAVFRWWLWKYNRHRSRRGDQSSSHFWRFLSSFPSNSGDNSWARCLQWWWRIWQCQSLKWLYQTRNNPLSWPINKQGQSTTRNNYRSHIAGHLHVHW